MKKPTFVRRPVRWRLLWWIICLLLAGCATSRSQEPVNKPVLPTSTRSDLIPTAPTASPLSRTEGTPEPKPATTTPSPTTDLSVQDAYQVFLPLALEPTDSLDQPVTSSQDARIAEMVIYDDTLDPNWMLEQSWGMNYDLSATAHMHSGTTAAAVTPTESHGTFFLTVREDAQAAYPRDRILGVSFWLSGGTNYIETDDLAVTIVGSNRYPYWVAGDTSVQQAEGISDEDMVHMPLFSETRLYYLGINRAIRPGEWAEVIVWLDERLYDPNYAYVTGMYIKNDADFLDAFYVDRVSLLVER